jgi:hypothetical protein
VGDEVKGAHGGLVGLRKPTPIVCGGAPAWCNEMKQEACRDRRTDGRPPERGTVLRAAVHAGVARHAH